MRFIKQNELAETVLEGGSGFYIWIRVNQNKFKDDFSVYEFFDR